MSLAIRLLPETQKSLAFGSIGAVYSGIGTALTQKIRIFFLQNLTDATLQFSFDGINDHFPLPPNGYILLDITANKTREQGFFVGEGQRIYVKEIGTPTSGSVYLSTFYGSEV